jgi:hypothetical protein
MTNATPTAEQLLCRDLQDACSEAVGRLDVIKSTIDGWTEQEPQEWENQMVLEAVTRVQEILERHKSQTQDGDA